MLLEEFEDVRAGKNKKGFCRGYLRERYLLEEWWKLGAEIMRGMLLLEGRHINEEEDKKKREREEVDGLLKGLEEGAEPLYELVPQAVREGVLRGEEKEVAKMRMMSLDTVFDMYCQKTGTDRRMRTWSDVQEAIDAGNGK